jgi:hypothetical protein
MVQLREKGGKVHQVPCHQAPAGADIVIFNLHLEHCVHSSKDIGHQGDERPVA